MNTGQAVWGNTPTRVHRYLYFVSNWQKLSRAHSTTTHRYNFSQIFWPGIVPVWKNWRDRKWRRDWRKDWPRPTFLRGGREGARPKTITDLWCVTDRSLASLFYERSHQQLTERDADNLHPNAGLKPWTPMAELGGVLKNLKGRAIS